MNRRGVRHRFLIRAAAATAAAPTTTCALHGGHAGPDSGDGAAKVPLKVVHLETSPADLHLHVWEIARINKSSCIQIPHDLLLKTAHSCRVKGQGCLIVPQTVSLSCDLEKYFSLHSLHTHN